jgi:ribosomal protein RSM22 (predicted rRNA methylase)
MTSPALPAELKAALEAKLHGLSRSEAADRAALISQTYRDGGNSRTIKSQTDALAYALARMPATYAAIAASLSALRENVPDFVPQSLLDAGAGPGTASWAAAEAFPSLRSFKLFDDNSALRTLALDLAQGSTRLSDMVYDKGEARVLLDRTEPADLVVASYVIGELDASAQIELAASLWGRTRDTLVIVEPGTPAGTDRVLALRRQLITAGAHVAVPCPHDAPCPLSAPDWCHFAQRLPRSRAHMQMKGAEVPFEDEKFAYVALTRTPVAHRSARVLAQPVAGKADILAKLCTAEGLVIARIPRRAKTEYARARRWRWGDAVKEER